jgi:hypothetical protein
VQGRRGVFERRLRSQVRRKALEGKSQECWGLREASKGLSSLRSRREGSQTLSTELLKIRATVFRRILQEMWQEGHLVPEMLKGRKAQARYTGLGCMVDMDPAYSVASEKEKTLKVA